MCNAYYLIVFIKTKRITDTSAVVLIIRIIQTVFFKSRLIFNLIVYNKCELLQITVVFNL